MGNLCGKAEDDLKPTDGSPTAQSKPALRQASSGTGKFSRSNLILDNTGSLTAVYDVEERKLGQGSYGSVSKAVHKSTKQVRAVKTIPKSKLKNIDSFRQEVNIMKALDHPNIIRLYETFEDHRNVYLVMSLCSGGELFDRLIEMGKLTEVQAAIIMQQILRAIFYLHENHIAHRDLKPENFLFQSKDAIEKSILKIIDFGLSTKFEDGEVLTMKAGTPYYVSPQVLQGKYDKSCDLWSCGVIMFILLCGYPPFHGDTDAEVLAKVRVGDFSFNPTHWKNVSEDAKDLIRKLLKFDPAERISAEQALLHTWVKNRAPRAPNVPLEAGHLDNLKAFKAQNKLKKAALQVIATQMPDAEIDNLKKIFHSLDRNGDGQLTTQELVEGLQTAGLSGMPEDLREIMQSIDADDSGVVDYSEFIAATLDRKKYIQEDRLWCAFRAFDLNGDGKISKNELEHVLAGGSVDAESKALVEAILNDHDSNNDGVIDFDEFVEMMRK